ncbi:xanthine dehydrogenase family protein molybdopterin-binding subunit [Saccharothrix deserti]|uniref:xanthine dehydrogenase family protein molybdopterin-binding subunit n=1 Tax=Saccharothrix deserti TaxID=2593674 RepID=UPI00131DFD88|nr:molybdopterin cofactor-binding domain-containing protein [Saccharothrix deserti]
MTTTRRQFLAGAVAVGFTLTAGSASAQGAGRIRVTAAGATTESWLVLTPGKITLYSGKVDIGTGIRTALTQIMVEELRLGVADVDYVEGDTMLSVGQGLTAGSKSIQNGGVQLRQAAATAFAELRRRAASHFGVDPSRLRAERGKFRVDRRAVSYSRLLAGEVTALPLDTQIPVMRPADYVVVGKSEPRVDLPAKLDATYRYLVDVDLPGMLHGRVVRPPGRNSRDPVIGDLDRARAIDGFVDVVRRDRFIGVVAASEWAAARAAAPATGITVDWTAGAKLIPQADLPVALRDPVNHYRTVVEIDTDLDPLFEAGPTVLDAQYFTPFYMHGAMGPSTAVADVRDAPDPATGIQVTIWSNTQRVGTLRAVIAVLLGLDQTKVRVVYTEGSGGYGQSGADDDAADAALLSQAVRRPVRVQWTRQNEHGWEPLGSAQAHDMKGAVGPDGITAWSHLFYAPPAIGGGNLAGALVGVLPGPLPGSSVNSSGRNAPVAYGFPQRVEARLVKTFDTTGPDSATPASPLTYRIPRTTSLRSLGGFSNSFANESFFDELAHAAGQDPLELRIKSLPDPRAVAVCEALREVWRSRPPGGNGIGAGVAFQQYEVENAYVAAYVELRVDLSTGQIRVTKVVVAHDCGLIINPDGVRNQIEGNVVQGISRTVKEEVHYNDDRVTSVVWQSSRFNPGPQYEVLRFNEVPSIETILINHVDEPALGAGEPTIGAIPGAIGNAVFAATGKRIRTLPLTPDRIRA